MIEPNQATQSLHQLAVHVEPYTGRQFPSDPWSRQPDSVRGFSVALKRLDRQKRSKAPQNDGPPQAGRSWRPEDERRVLEQFDARIHPAGGCWPLESAPEVRMGASNGLTSAPCVLSVTP
jgi:hypothetical protein